jgi:hypothetical protein
MFSTDISGLPFAIPTGRQSWAQLVLPMAGPATSKKNPAGRIE